MSLLDILIINETDTLVDLCKACIETTPLYPGATISLPLTVRSWIHGHSDCGGFVITRYDNTFTKKTWGIFEITIEETKHDFIFHLTHKK